MDSIEDILSDLGISYFREGGHHHARPGWLQMDCPFCGPDSGRYHLGFNLHARYFACWKCGGLHPWKVLRAFGIANPREIMEGIQGADHPEEEKTKAAGRLVEPKHRGPLQKPHRHYLRNRGYEPKEIERLWQIEGIGIASRLSWRIYLPITWKRRRVSWTTRSISDRGQRYISASAQEEAIPHKHIVYGADYCRQSIVVVEGPLDAWRVGPGAGALFGTAYTQAQLSILSHYPYRTICFDAAPEAQERAEQLAGDLCCFPGITEVVVLDAADPGSASRREIRALRKAAKLD